MDRRGFFKKIGTALGVCAGAVLAGKLPKDNPFRISNDTGTAVDLSQYRDVGFPLLPEHVRQHLIEEMRKKVIIRAGRQCGKSELMEQWVKKYRSPHNNGKSIDIMIRRG